MPANLRPHFLLFAVNLIYGANYSIAKIAMPAFIGPCGFIVIRVVCACGLYWVFHKHFIKEKVERKDLPLLAVCGLFGVAINQLMFFKGLSITTEINASLIMITTPILVLLVSHLVLRERISFAKVAGVVLGGAGVATLILTKKDAAITSGGFWGDVFVLINAASYGIYLVLVKSLMKKYNPITVVKWVFFFGMLVVVPVGANELTLVDWNELPAKVWLTLAFVVVFTTFLAYLLNAAALKIANPSLVSTYIYTQPLIASVIAVSIGNDEISVGKLAAAALIFVGVYLVSKRG